MKINTLRLENWKCFPDQLELDFSNIEIFSFPNGSGKTSVLEALYYGLWGKTDNKLSSYQNHDGQTKVDVSFEVDGIQYEISREYPNTKAVLYKNGEKFREGVRELYEYMDSMVSYSLVKRLWFKGDIAENDVLDFNFFKNEILEDKLKEPNTLHKYYSQQVRANSKAAKDIVVDSFLRKIEEVDYDIKTLTSKLKNKTSVNDNEYTRALQVKNDVENFKKISDFFSEVSPLTQETIYKWKQIDLDNTKKLLSAEEGKLSDSVLSKVSPTALRSILNSNNTNHKCVVCNGEWSDSRSNYVTDILNKGLKSFDVIADLKQKITFKESIDKTMVDKSEEYYQLERDSQRMPNYQEVIDSYNKENDLLWDSLQELNRERDNILRNKNASDRKAVLEKQVERDKKKVNFLRDYLDKSTEYYTRALLEKSNEILNGINKNYTNLSISSEDNALQVDVRGSTLLVSQLSRGERTMVAMSLIYSIRDIFTPNMPLIFDESFASLSEENNLGVINFIKDSDEQLFIISHSVQWTEYSGYDNATTNVRTSW